MKINKIYYLHKVELATMRNIIVVDNNETAQITYTYLNGFPVVSGGGKAKNINHWTLGPVATENEAKTLSVTIAQRYGYDVMINNQLLGVPYRDRHD